jgi:uncharacterized protein
MCDSSKSNIVVEIARTLYDKSIEHGLYHVERVYNWANRIIEMEGLEVDQLILKLAVYLHDVGRGVGEPHAYYSALIARELLREAECSEGEIEEVVEAIESHSFSYSAGRRSVYSDLAKVLSDADKIDALGLIGFIRVFLYSERRGRSIGESIEHFHEKILKLHELMNYNYSKAIAKEYTERVKMLLELLIKELRGQ